MNVLHTPRLELRAWQDADRAPFAALNADPEVMEFMPRRLTPAESDELIASAQRVLEQRGWGLWAVATHPQREFLGFTGLNPVSFSAPFTPCTEVLWRLKRAAWGRGYATEAARACLDFAFARLALPEVVAFTVPANRRSRAVMERLGMRHDGAADFEHPRLAAGHPLRPHVLYRISRASGSQDGRAAPAPPADG
jgi:RimJ/RimL family protein N-acetyltransferase